MSADERIERVGVVGGGIMGCGIAEVMARAGADVILVEVDEDAAARALGRIETSVRRAVERGKAEPDDAEAAIGRLTVTDELAALADRQLVVEAIVEDKAAKLALFQRLAEVVEDRDALLASNTSSIPIVELGSATGARATQVLGLHFFNPVPVLSLVEVIPSLLTAPEVTERAHLIRIEEEL
jgi:3-hydroxybutyryl-CoA dehydrogenase